LETIQNKREIKAGDHLDYKIFPEESIGLLNTARAHGSCSCSPLEKPRRDALMLLHSPLLRKLALSLAAKASTRSTMQPAERMECKLYLRLEFVVAVTDRALAFGLPVDS
jgi:hypothetical protein